MQVGGGGSLRSDINVTPLVDVVLVLLIIFMVITPVVQMGYLVKVPPKAPANLPPSAVQDQIVLRLGQNNRVLINKEEMDLTAFPNRIREIMRGNPAKMVFFSGARDVDYDSTLKFLDLARQSGAKNIGIIVEDPMASPTSPQKPFVDGPGERRALAPRFCLSAILWSGGRPRPPVSRETSAPEGGRRSTVHRKSVCSARCNQRSRVFARDKLNLRPIRQHKHPPRQIRIQHLARVVPIENRRLPRQEIRVVVRERRPVLVRGERHPLADQYEIRPGDGLVIQLRRSVVRREAAKVVDEAAQRIRRRRFLAQILPRHLHVLRVMKLGGGEGEILETRDEIAHRFFSTSLCASALVR